MITIKLPYNASEASLFQETLKQARKEYSSVVRYSFKRFHEKLSQKDIRQSLKQLNNISTIGFLLKQCAILEGQQLFKRFKDKPNIIFGGKLLFAQRAKNQISKEEFQERRLLPLNVQGTKSNHGNCLFKLDIIDNNSIVFKFNRNKHFILELPKLKANFKKQLYRLQELNENEGYTYSVKLDDRYICISFEEFLNKEEQKYIENRYMGIDLNPDTIGVSIAENEKVIYTREYSLKSIFDKILSQSNTSSSIEMKHLQNKLTFETFEISKSIAKFAKCFRCQNVFIEDLKFSSRVSNKFNHAGNRKCRNLWKRNKLTENLKKRLNIYSIHIYEVNPAYSSVIGNLQHDYTDAINASIEVGRRGFEWKINKSKDKFYPHIWLKKSAQHLWKEMGTENAKSWKELSLLLKNLKVKYRVSLDDAKKLHQYNVFRLNHSDKSCVLLHNFI